MYDEDDLLPLSGLQHLLFCERQCALIHVEGVWAENALTVEGDLFHRSVDLPGSTERAGLRIARWLVVRSLTLGLTGRCDVVEFPASGDGRGTPMPVEYKRGRRQRWRHDEVQLCAQGMALEEMLGLPVSSGALYYGKSRRRLAVAFDDALRTRTRVAAARFRELIDARLTPRAAPTPKCRSCSLRDSCQPGATASGDTASKFLARVLSGAEATDS